MHEGWPKLQIYLVDLRSRNRGPYCLPTIRRLGIKSVQYFEALHCLSNEGCESAAYAISRLTKEVINHRTDSLKILRKLIEENEAAPVDLVPTARWKVDRIGLVALQILLWLWHLRCTSQEDDGWSIYARDLEPFDSDSARKWWYFGRLAFTYFYHHPEGLPWFYSCVKPSSCRGSRIKSRNYIIRKLRERFLSFSHPPLGYG